MNHTDFRSTRVRRYEEPTPLETIKASLAANIAFARENGYTGTDEDYQHTAFDIDAVIRDLGRRPTREEWAVVSMAGTAPAAEE